MTTQHKIQKLDSLRDSLVRDAWTVVVGRFDPMTCEAAGALEAFAAPERKLLVVLQRTVPKAGQKPLQRREGQLLNVNARAILVAALRAVDAVLVEESDAWRDAVCQNANIRLVENPAVENEREQSFRELILHRGSDAGA